METETQRDRDTEMETETERQRLRDRDTERQRIGSQVRSPITPEPHGYKHPPTRSPRRPPHTHLNYDNKSPSNTF